MPTVMVSSVASRRVLWLIPIVRWCIHSSIFKIIHLESAFIIWVPFSFSINDLCFYWNRGEELAPTLLGVQELRRSVVTGSLTKSSVKREVKIIVTLICSITYIFTKTKNAFKPKGLKAFLLNKKNLGYWIVIRASKFSF